MNALKKAVKKFGLEVPRLEDFRVRIPPGGPNRRPGRDHHHLEVRRGSTRGTFSTTRRRLGSAGRRGDRDREDAQRPSRPTPKPRIPDAGRGRQRCDTRRCAGNHSRVVDARARRHSRPVAPGRARGLRDQARGRSALPALRERARGGRRAAPHVPDDTYRFPPARTSPAATSTGARLCCVSRASSASTPRRCARVTWMASSPSPRGAPSSACAAYDLAAADLPRRCRTFDAALEGRGAAKRRPLRFELHRSRRRLAPWSRRPRRGGRRPARFGSRGGNGGPLRGARGEAPRGRSGTAAEGTHYVAVVREEIEQRGPGARTLLHRLHAPRCFPRATCGRSRNSQRVVIRALRESKNVNRHVILAMANLYAELAEEYVDAYSHRRACFFDAARFQELSEAAVAVCMRWWPTGTERPRSWRQRTGDWRPSWPLR